jgi:hypothetical protein
MHRVFNGATVPLCQQASQAFYRLETRLKSLCIYLNTPTKWALIPFPGFLKTEDIKTGNPMKNYPN